MKKIKHNDLTHYFLRDHKQLPAAYLASCKKFFDSLNHFMGEDNAKNIVQDLKESASRKQQATSRKPQAPSLTNKE